MRLLVIWIISAHGCILRTYADIPENDSGLQRWIICAHKQVPWDMDVFCVPTQIFLKMILAFQRWIICAYEQVPRGMDVFCVRTQIFLKMLLTFQRWIICTSLLRFDESISAQNPTMVRRLLRIYRELYKSLFGISAHMCKNSRLC